jgi:hypothetical protein
MPIVLTVDQRRSRRAADQVGPLLEQLRSRRPRPLRAFQRTAGDEVQGVFDDADPDAAVDTVLQLVRGGVWSIGVGVGAVELPLPRVTRAGRGAAFERARTAVERAKRRPSRLAVVGPDPDRAHDAETALSLVAAIIDRRTQAAWEAVDLAVEGMQVQEIASRLAVSRQAVGQRLATAQWQLERDARPLAARLLREACR